MRLFRLFGLVLVCIARFAKAQSVSWQPESVVQASPVLFTVTLDRPAKHVAATWLGKSFTFSPEQTQRTWYALAGPDVEQKPGIYPITIDASYASGATLHLTQQVQVADGNFHSSTLAVAGKFIAPSREQQLQQQRDVAAKKIAFADSSDHPLWSGSFAAPVSSTVFPNYGDNRVFNGKKVSIHRGSDFPARIGTPVHATNSGRVVLAQKLFLEGNCVIVDHGNQLFTIYMHFSKLEVKAGEMVQKGQVLGLSGATGRVTGPHLHVSLRWEGESLNPASLLKMQLPMLDAADSAASPIRVLKRLHR